MKLKIVFTAVLLVTLVLSCEKKESETSWLYIEETHCSNAWDDLDYDSTKNKVTKYLENNGITIYDFDAEVYSNGPFCEACFCPSGRNIRVLIPDDNIVTLKRLGFKK